MVWKSGVITKWRRQLAIALIFIVMGVVLWTYLVVTGPTIKKSVTSSNTATSLRILPLGDSITQANRNHKSYRYNLWAKLTDAGIDFDFVGSLKSNYGGNPEWPEYRGRSFDPDHEGHWGWRADEILYGMSGEEEGNLSIWLDTYTPDIVLMHLGTNDIAQLQDLRETANELRQIIGSLRAENPNVIILLSNLIPIRNMYLNKRIEKFNAEIQAIAKKMNTDISPVIFVNQYTEFDVKLDSYDGIHPNERGEEKMAGQWFQSLQEILRQPPITSSPH